MKILSFFRTVIVTFWVVAVLAAPASGQTGLEIMKKAKDTHKSQDEQSNVKMILVDPQGNKKERKIVNYAKTDKGDLSKTLMRFLSPRDVENTGLLTWEQKGGDDDQWLYLPAAGRPKRIASSGKKNRFMGTDFSYEDLRLEKLDAYEYNLAGSENVDGKPCFVVEALPKTDREKQDSGYSKRKFWILKDTHFSLKREFYDKTGTLEKIELSLDLKSLGGTLWRANTTEMQDVRKKSKTLLVVENRKLNQGLSDQLFSERELTKGK